MAHRRFPILVIAPAIVSWAIVAATFPVLGAERRPNIVFFLVDDMGWMDSTVLHVEPKNKSPFVATASVKIPGPVVLTFRVKVPAGGQGKIQWRTAGQETFPADGQIVAFDMPEGAEWQEVRVDVPVKGTLVYVRLYPTPAEEIEIDWIRMSGSGGVIRQWDFGDAPK